MRLTVQLVKVYRTVSDAYRLWQTVQRTVIALPKARHSTGKISAAQFVLAREHMHDIIADLLTRIHPADNAKWRIEEREHKVHRYHAPKLIAIVDVQILSLYRVDQQS